MRPCMTMRICSKSTCACCRTRSLAPPSRPSSSPSAVFKTRWTQRRWCATRARRVYGQAEENRLIPDLGILPPAAAWRVRVGNGTQLTTLQLFHILVPARQRDCLQALGLFLADVAEMSHQNKMKADNLAKVGL